MRFRYLLSSLFFVPWVAFSQIPWDQGNIVMPAEPAPKNSVVWTYSNETEYLDAIKTQMRSDDYPTQVLRISSNIEGLNLTCDQVSQEKKAKIFNQLSSDK